MADITVSIINESTVDTIDDATVQSAVAALQRQVHEHFAPVWGIDADLVVVAADTQPSAGSWWLVILDNSDQAGALGYHDLTQEGLPLGKVFAKTDIDFNEEWTVTASHELLELLADPDINLTAFVQNAADTGILYAYEVCDACEADQFGYEIDGVLVSDFVYPAWFESFRQEGSTQFDYGKHIDKPFELLAGGYIGVFDVRAGTGWHQLTPPGSRLKAHMRARVGSRRERRRTPRKEWLKSRV